MDAIGDDAERNPRCVERAMCCTKLAKEREPRGFIYVSAARGPVVIFGALVASVAINEYARSVSDCDGNILNGSLKASSVLSSLGAIEGVLNAILSPFMGTFADLTPYRKPALGFAFFVFTFLVAVQGVLFFPHDSTLLDPNVESNKNASTPEEDLVYLQEPLWNTDIALMFLVVSVVIQVVAYEVAALLTVTYSAELSHDAAKMTGYVSLAYTTLNGMQLVLAAVVTGISLVFGLTSFEQGVVGAALVVILTAAWFLPGFPKLGQRREISDEIKRGCCGLNHMRDLIKDIFTNYRQLLKLLISWTLASASLSSITILSTSYLQFHLGYRGVVVSALLSLALLFSVPGSLLTKYLVKRFNLRVVYVSILVVFGLSFVAAPFLLISEPVNINSGNSTITFTQYGKCTDADPESSANEVLREAPGYVLFITAFFTALWGIGIGSVYVANNAFYASLIPGARESSFFGIKVTFAKVFTWVPPLLYTLINEKFDSVQFAILILAPFFLAGAVVAAFIDYDKGCEDVAHTLHLRRGEGYRAEELSATTATVGDESI